MKSNASAAASHQHVSGSSRRGAGGEVFTHGRKAADTGRLASRQCRGGMRRQTPRERQNAHPRELTADRVTTAAPPDAGRRTADRVAAARPP